MHWSFGLYSFKQTRNRFPKDALCQIFFKLTSFSGDGDKCGKLTKMKRLTMGKFLSEKFN